MKNKDLGSKKSPTPEMSATTTASRAKFTDEFKRMAVGKLRETGTNATLLALELGIRRNQLYKWAKALDGLEPDKNLRTPGRPPIGEESEVARLRRELAAAQQELAILRKFDAYLTHLKK